MAKNSRQQTEPIQRPPLSDILAVIELGSSSVRMAIAQTRPDGSLNMLDSLQQTVALGKDAFTKGSIGQETVEECVGALRSFQTALREYGTTPGARIRAVATSALREAQNREAVLDRICIATGLAVEVMDEAEVNRYTYLAVQNALESSPRLREQAVLAIEIGGGNAEYLILRAGEVLTSGALRLGSLRIRETLEEGRFPCGTSRDALTAHIRQSIAPLAAIAQSYPNVQLLALGGDIRFAAAHLGARRDRGSIARLDLARLAALTATMLDLSVEETARKHHLSPPDAETLAPALLAHVEIARLLRQKRIHTAQTNLREGLLENMASRDSWSPSFRKQVLRSAINVGRKYSFDAQHAGRVCELCRQLFAALQSEHRLDSRHELLLCVAAWLHDIGHFVSERSHHKHSMYLILQSDIFGLSARDLHLVALTARYHRRASPKPVHELYGQLDRDRRIAVVKMAALLRVADALSRPLHKLKRDIQATIEDRQVILHVKSAGEPILEKQALRGKGPFFREVFGKELILA
jgi:exopolyphosphatase / guanosine-5'-triphosphate,3'-diphosphate pyrophosphatase